MTDSILDTIKSMLGPDAAYDVFDQDIIVLINMVFTTLQQLGVGPENGFRITGSEETWADYLGNAENLESVKSYMFMRVKMIFDPPASSSAMTAYQDACKELESRINYIVDKGAY